MPISNPSTALVAKAGDTMTGALNWATTQTIASATTTDIGAATSNSVIVSGTTTITGLGTIAAGAERVVQFSGALTLTHNETSLILPGGANITTADGDVAYFVSLGAGNWRCTGYQKANGQSVVASGGSPGGSTTQVQYNNAGAFAGMSGWSWDDTNRALTATGATVTTSKPLYWGTQTWNNASTAFTAFGYDITLTAFNASGSKALKITYNSGAGTYLSIDANSGLTSLIAATTTGRVTAGTDVIVSNGLLYLNSAGDTAIKRNAAGVAEINNGTGGTFRDLKLRSLISSGGFVATDAAAPTIASASTIAPAKQVSFVSGTTTISTITAPAPISSGGGQITLIPTGLWSTDTAGNIALATTAVVSKALILTYDTTTGKWYPSY